MSLSFISHNIIAAGNNVRVNQVIDITRGEGKSILDTNKYHLKSVSLSQVDPRSLIFFAFIIPEDLKKLHSINDTETADLSNAELIFGRFDYDFNNYAWCGSIHLVSNNPDNDNLVSYLNGMKETAASFIPGLRDSINFKATPESITASFSLTSELLKALKDKVY